MRIAHIVQSVQLGGQEQLVLDLCRRFADWGHEMIVVSLTPGGSLRGEFGKVQVLDVPRKSGADRLLPVRVAKLLHDLRPDVVHSHNPAAMIYGATAARMSGVPCVVHTKHGRNRYSPRLLAVVRMLVQSLSAVACVSKETAQVAREKERVPERLLYVVPNGIPLDHFSHSEEARRRARAELGIPEAAFVAGSVGRLSREKDYPLLVRTMGPLLGPERRLIIIGEGADRPRIEAQVAALGDAARYVHLLGLRRDVPQLLSALDVFCLTSYTEGLPLVIPEAMACGLPVVATAVGGVPGIVPESVGVLRPHGDEEGLRAALAALASDAAQRARLGAAAKIHAHEHFSLETMAQRYAALYQLHEDRAVVARRLIGGLGGLWGPI